MQIYNIYGKFQNKYMFFKKSVDKGEKRWYTDQVACERLQEIKAWKQWIGHWKLNSINEIKHEKYLSIIWVKVGFFETNAWQSKSELNELIKWSK